MPRSFAIIAVGALLFWATDAAAEDQESRFTFHPSLLVTLLADDDPYLEERNDEALGGWFAPGLELGYRADFFELQADLGADVRRYIGEGDLSEEFYRAIVDGEVGILPGLTLRVSNAFKPQSERISSPADATRNLQQTNQVDAEFRYWRELPGRRELLMSFRGSHFIGEDFNAVLFTDDFGVIPHPDFEPDHWEGATKLELQAPFGKRNSLYARSEFEYRTYSEFEVPDRGEFAILAGMRTRHFRNVEIDLAVGYGIVSFESSDDLHRFVGEGSLRWRLPEGWTWRVSAANRFVSDLAGNVFVETTGRMGIEKHFGELISASVAAFVSRLENDAWNVPKNLFGGAEFRIQSRVGRHTVVAITYRYWDNAGDFEMDDFNQDRVAIEFFYRR
jgi:muconolactone delta-isomerase